MVDAGPPGISESFKRQLNSLEIQPNQLKLIVLTHGDIDHIGSAKDIQLATGAKVIIHENDRRYLEEGIFNWPPGVTGWGKISRYLLNPFLQNMPFPKYIPDIIMSTPDFSLKKFGIDGKIIYTPGHTWGSVSLILQTGETFVGCMAHNGLPFTLTPQLPIYATDLDRLKESWYVLLENGAKMIYPAHGNPFLADRIMKRINRM